jgi:hypothetical protein
MIARRRMVGRRVARVAVGTAVVAGTAGAVHHHQQQKYAQQDEAEYEAQMDQQQQYAPPPPAPAAAPEPAEDPIEQIERLGKLKEEGLLTDEEFAAQKAKILGT